MIFDANLAKAVYNLGHSLIHDDSGDLGYMSYYGRKNHTYHGKSSPNHPSPFHHWQIGTLLCMVAQFMSIGALAQDVYDTPSDESIE
jgi:hypothetical protein